LLAALVAAVAGCANGGKADVTGKVTHRGKPVIFGTVILQGPDGIAMTGAIQPDGTYLVQGVAAGPALVGVVSRDPAVRARSSPGRKEKEDDAPPPPPSGPVLDRTKWFPLPEKYEDPARSGLTTTLKAGANTYDIDLP
jgi:hypothetical protein